MSTIFRIDSRDRDPNDTKSNTDFIVNCLPTHVRSARLKQVTIPNLFNNIRDAPVSDVNNVYTYESNDVEFSFTIAPGFYSIEDLLDLIEAGQIAQGVTGVTFTIDPNTGLITVVNASGVDYSVINTPGGNIMASVLGILTSVSFATATSYTLDEKVNLHSYNQIFVESKKLSNGHNVTSGSRRFPIIATVPVDTAYGSNIVYEPQQHTDIHFGTDTNIEESDIRITNHFGEQLLLPSNHHVTVLYEFNTTTVR